MKRICLAVLVAFAFGLFSGSTSGQPKQKKTNAPQTKTAPSKAKPFPTQPKKKKKEAKKTPASKPTPPKHPESLKKWNQLDARRREIGKTLRELRRKFQVASRARKLEIQKDFEALIAEWTDKIEPAMIDLAFDVLEDQPKNKLAFDMVANSGRYAEIAKVMTSLMNAGHTGSDIVRAAAMANFSLNQFTEAQKILEAAKAKRELDFAETSLLEDTKKHVEYWAKEQAIREKEAKLPPDQKLPRVEMKTNKGTVVLELFENEAPNTVANFISLVEDKFYDGLHFHRVVPNFVVQIGDPATRKDYDPKKPYGFGGPGYSIKCECYEKNARLHFRGSLSMAHSGRDSGGSQFFITHVPTHRLNAPPHGIHSHTVFGRVVSGMDVIDAIKKDDRIEKMTVLNKRNHPYVPKKVGDKEEGKTEPGKTTPSKSKEDSTTPKKPIKTGKSTPPPKKK
ncbi:MAG: hypothetical protein Tsb009_14500 [Planctomycetaceae bacterium]